MLRRLTNTRLEYKKWFVFIVIAFCFVYILRRQKLPEKASVLDHNISRKPQNYNEVKEKKVDDAEKYVSKRLSVKAKSMSDAEKEVYKRLSKIKQNCGDVCKTDSSHLDPDVLNGNSIDLKNVENHLGIFTI